MKRSAGTLLFRHSETGLEVLLVHPSGAYNRHKPWSIPKGIPDPEETIEAAARRETHEETGVLVESPLVSLGSIVYQKSGKEIFCFACLAPAAAEPHCASWEVDRAEFVSLEQARLILHPEQVVFLDRLDAERQTGNL